MSTTPQTTLAARVRELGAANRWPAIVVNGRAYAESESAYEGMLRTATRFDLEQALRQLEEIEERQIQRDKREDVEYAREAARNGPDPTFDAVLEILADAKERAERAATMEGRLERVEKALLEIRDALAAGHK